MTTSREINGIRISYGPYLRAFGKSPRGTGMWAFFLGSSEGEMKTYYGKFSEACRMVVSEARALGITSLVLGS